MVDRLQQGVLNTLYLGRLMLSSQGLAANPAFQLLGRSVPRHLAPVLRRQQPGGIEGGLTTAVAPDFRRAALGVTGIDYGNLLVQRSTDFAPFKGILNASYRDPSLYPVILDVIDQLWVRGDPEGYAPQMTSHPLPGTPSHVVLMQNAYGDFQVSMFAGAAEARTIGARAYKPALDPSRKRDRNLFYGIPAIGHYPYGGSAVEIWDSGPGRVQPPPVGNIPPTKSARQQRPSLRPAQHARGAAPDLGLPRSERDGGRCLWRQALPQLRLHAVSAPEARAPSAPACDVDGEDSADRALLRVALA